MNLESDFIATASHELRTPLTSVLMGVHLLLERAAGELTDKQVEVLSACREDCERLDKLMRDLLDLSRIEPRNAVATVLVKPQTIPKDPQPLIKTITMNGFTILDDEETPSLDHSERRFIVTTPAGHKHDVLVEIDAEAIAYVERMTRRRLEPESSFWTLEARSLLSDYLWKERKVPPMRRLVLRSLDPDRLPIAARWKAEGMKRN